MNASFLRALPAHGCTCTPRRRATRTVAALLGAFLLAGSRAGAATLFASPAGSGAACSSPATPCSLCGALDAATDGDIVYLAGGTFTGGCGPGSAVAPVASDLRLLGGWTGTAATPPARDASETILDGEGVNRVVDVSPGHTLVLDGLTIDRGFAAQIGGGVLATDANLTLNNVTVKRCVAGTTGSALDSGGGGLMSDGGSLLVRDSRFLDNQTRCTGCSSTDGGGIAIIDPTSATVERSLFQGNNAWWGKGIYAEGTGAAAVVTVRETTFSANRGSGYGGALGLRNVALSILDSTFRNNWAGNDGGAIFQVNGSLEIRRCRFAGNSSDRAAGIRVDAPSLLSVENSIFADNASANPTAGERIGGLVVIGGMAGGAVVRHTTFVGAVTALSQIGVQIHAGSHVDVTLQNNLFARLGEGVSVIGGAGDGPHVFIAGTLWGAAAWATTTPFAVDSGAATIVPSADLTGDPAFVDGDYHIGPTSAARDQALAYAGGPMRDDIDTVRRIDTPDLGADEYLTRVRVGTPNGGEILAAGATATLKWDASASATSFDISYSLDRGTTWKSIQKGHAAKTLDWTVPRPAKNVAGGYIKVVAKNAAGRVVGYDRSDNTFRVEVVRLTAPSGGETINGGVPSTVTWETNGTKLPVNKVLLFLSQNGGETWRQIAPAPAPWNPGSAAWTPPTVTTARAKCLVKVVLKSAAGTTIGSDVSDSFFRIQ